MSETITSEKIHISNFDIKYFVQDVISSKEMEKYVRCNTRVGFP